MQNDSEKFYDTYGKDVSFDKFSGESGIDFSTSFKSETTQKIPLTNKIKRYFALTIFTAIGLSLLFIGGVFIFIFLAIMIVAMIVRTIFNKPNQNSSGFFIIRK